MAEEGHINIHYWNKEDSLQEIKNENQPFAPCFYTQWTILYHCTYLFYPQQSACCRSVCTLRNALHMQKNPHCVFSINLVYLVMLLSECKTAHNSSVIITHPTPCGIFLDSPTCYKSSYPLHIKWQSSLYLLMVTHEGRPTRKVSMGSIAFDEILFAWWSLTMQGAQIHAFAPADKSCVRFI